jgi:hypothetical protein
MRCHRPGRLLLPPVILVLALAGAAAEGPGELAGLWVLAEQRYEGGGAGLAPTDPPLHLRVESTATGLAVHVGRGESFLPWPALVANGKPVAITVLERSEDPGGSGIRVFWTARPGPDDRGRMEVEQRLVPGPEDSLLETVRVSLFLDGEARGGYTLTRTYRRDGGRP